MSGTRGIELPFEHLTAELAAAPLALDRAFQLSIVSLEGDMGSSAGGMRGSRSDMGSPTGSLWRATEAEIVKSFPSYSIDEVTSLRDWLWFQEKEEGHKTHLDQYLRHVAASTLAFSGNVFRPRLPPWSDESSHTPVGSNDARARRFWRWVSFALPPDLLMAAHPAPGAVSAEVKLVSPILSKLLQDRGYVEPHMHVGAALDYSLLWIATLHALADPQKIQHDSFYSPGANWNEGRELAHWLVRAAIARYVLAVFLHDFGSSFEKDFNAFLEHDVYLRFEPAPKSEDGNEVPPRYANPSIWPFLKLCLHELMTGKLGDEKSFVAMQRLYAKLTSIRHRWPRFPDDIDDAYGADPIESLFPARESGQRTSEMEWLAAGLKYAESKEGRKDITFCHLFWQVVRLRIHHYRHVVQRPLTPGLQWFIRFYGRMKPSGNMLSFNLMVHSAAKMCGYGQGLKALEFRTSPKIDISEMRKVVDDSVKAAYDLHREAVHLDSGASSREGADEYVQERYRQRGSGRKEYGKEDRDTPLVSDTEFGLILHFGRERGGGAEKGQPQARGRDSHADPGWRKNLGYRYGRYYKQKRREAYAWASMMRRFPWTLTMVRGIDLCSDELGVPTWVMAPLVRYVRDVSRAASAHVQSEWGEELPPLRSTIHVGEEFVHLLGGLRRIDEAVELLKLGQGDRLGHSIALGVNPTLWANRTSAIAITRMERLLDLAWEWSFSTSRAIDISASRIQYIIHQIERLSNDVFGEFAHPPQVARFSEYLGREDELRRMGFPNGPMPDMDSYVYAGADKTPGEWVNPALFGEMLSAHDRRGQTLSANQLQDITKHLHDMFKSRQGDEPLRLLYRYLVEPQTFQRGQQLILVDPSFEATALTMMQDELRKKVGSLGITVEINPSSNLLIGNLSDLKNHPLWRLKPPESDSAVRPVALSLGSDDPLTFSTRTREEYQLIYDTLTLAGLSDEEAGKWLNDVRESGLVSRFTLPIPHSPTQLWTRMDVDIRHLEPLL